MALIFGQLNSANLDIENTECREGRSLQKGVLSIFYRSIELYIAAVTWGSGHSNEIK